VAELPGLGLALKALLQLVNLVQAFSAVSAPVRGVEVLEPSEGYTSGRLIEYPVPNTPYRCRERLTSNPAVLRMYDASCLSAPYRLPSYSPKLPKSHARFDLSFILSTLWRPESVIHLFRHIM
jgi:hypothetical protein